MVGRLQLFDFFRQSFDVNVGIHSVSDVRQRGDAGTCPATVTCEKLFKPVVQFAALTFFSLFAVRFCLGQNQGAICKVLYPSN